MNPSIRLRGVSFRYSSQEEETLHDIDLDVYPGECVVVTGPSGCGKTTLTRLVNGLIPHAYEGDVSGIVQVNEHNVADWSSDELGVEVGSVFQNPRSQFVNVDVTSEIAFGCENLGLAREQIVTRVMESSAALDIEYLMGRDVEELSGGQRQSVILASAYAMHPDVFVLDEPTASLDIDSIRRLAEVVSQLKARGKTVLVSEHRLWWLADIADRVVIMENGDITAQWTAAEFAALSGEERHDRGLRAWSQAEAFIPDPAGKDGARDREIRERTEGTDALAAQGLTVGYRRDAPLLQNLDITLSQGRIVGIIGRNGAGKTTLLRCLCGLTRESAGMVAIDGTVLKARHRSGLVHLVMQEPGYQLFADNVLAEAVSASTAEDCEGDARAMLERFGLLPFAHRHPLSLSGGERQRLSIAVGMLRAAPVMLLDEPTSGLDYRNMRKVAQALKQAAQDGRAICIVTHDLEFLYETCDEIAEIDNGTIEATYPLDAEATIRVAKRFGFSAAKTSG